MTDLLNKDLWTSVPGPTYPNRHFFHCATAAGYTANNGAFLGVPCRTIYENMADHGNSYKFYSPQLKSTPLLYRNLRNIYNWMRIKNMSTFFEDARADYLMQANHTSVFWQCYKFVDQLMYDDISTNSIDPTAIYTHCYQLHRVIVQIGRFRWVAYNRLIQHSSIVKQP
ncbi:hypothetical protein BATDEDRAFT_24374 [Batrachochytrium dendrobatidis JAM81]|uniref:Uncharacterized protein n=1 Tax=Batrachochytrium dendrobatidis (strain JAM81 / FGSC 10211) TaxID=684364 RepID=F4P1D0_BATDJ|nr:uncharacterized protein BATDEDRAFT_24374 [Batrachochytrium dendrobatidis JAM81]EGF80887.1 hypothetical protein BATDEDRAFT_24374 [Batrachochytrium dendrobatidis JAM81]|eukprot:XP_006678430.1 hypothetical protein BATDEDRAFT_24374 [Batrachochytrium dendrobatidis JAM81]